MFTNMMNMLLVIIIRRMYTNLYLLIRMACVAVKFVAREILWPGRNEPFDVVGFIQWTNFGST